MTAAAQTAWPEPTHRGYHSVSLLLKDGRILIGGGKDGTHATGCEKNELRIYTPPYLQGNPTRPAITNITEGQNIQVGSGNFTINYTGTLKSTRGVALVALGSLTHAFDMGQRYVPLTVVSGGGGHRLGHREAAHQHQHRAAGLLQPVRHQQRGRALDGQSASG